MRPFVILGFLILSVPASGQDEAEPQHVLVASGSAAYLFQVSATKRVTQLPFAFARNPFAWAWRPRLSPDERWVAFTRHGDFFLLNVSTREERTITDLSAEGSDSSASAALVAQWSPESRRLLYRVEHTSYDPDAGEIMSSRYYIYSLESNISTPAMVGGDVQCWLPNGDFVTSLTYPEHRSCLVRVAGHADSIGASPHVEILLCCRPEHPFCFDQVDPSPDGSRLVMWYSPEPHSAEISELDLATHRMSPLSPLGDESQLRWPSYSPSGRHLAYIEQRPSDVAAPSGEFNFNVQVDGRQVFSCRAASRTSCSHSWISDSALAVTCNDSLHVLDAVTGAAIGEPIHLLEVTEEPLPPAGVPNRPNHYTR